VALDGTRALAQAAPSSPAWRTVPADVALPERPVPALLDLYPPANWRAFARVVTGALVAVSVDSRGHDAVQQAFARYGGVCLENLLGVFFVELSPRAAVERAALAALEAAAKVARLRERYGDPLEFHAAIHWGQAVCELHAIDAGALFVVDGVDPATTYRLLAETEAECSISHVALRTLGRGDFATSRGGSVREPCRTRRIPFDVLHGPRGAHVARPRHKRRMLFGQGRVLARLEAQLTRALSGHGGVLGIAGGAGTGKSFILSPLVDAWSARATAHVSRCDPALRTTPLAPIVPILRQLLGASIERVHAEGEDPLFALLQAGQSQGRWGDEDTRARMLARVASALADAAPLLLVLEDLHHADPFTLQLLPLLAGHARARALLVLATLRPSPSWTFAEALDATVTLDPWEAGTVEQATLHFYGASVLGAGLLPVLCQKSAHNPRRLMQILRFLRTFRLVQVRGGAASPVVPIAQLACLIPAEVGAVVDAFPRARRETRPGTPLERAPALHLGLAEGLRALPLELYGEIQEAVAEQFALSSHPHVALAEFARAAERAERNQDHQSACRLIDRWFETAARLPERQTPHAGLHARLAAQHFASYRKFAPTPDILRRGRQVLSLYGEALLREDHILLCLGMGQALARLGHRDKAEAFLRRAELLQPGPKQARELGIAQAELCRIRGEPQKGLEAVREAVRQTKRGTDEALRLELLRGDLLLEQGNLREAGATYEETAGTAARAGLTAVVEAAWGGAARASLLEQDFPHARAALAKTRPGLRLAELLVWREDYDGARPLLDRAAEQATAAGHESLLGEIYVLLGVTVAYTEHLAAGLRLCEEGHRTLGESQTVTALMADLLLARLRGLPLAAATGRYARISDYPLLLAAMRALAR
jgi:predicted negative regulator of RcsB-dependent stress response